MAEAIYLKTNRTLTHERFGEVMSIIDPNIAERKVGTLLNMLDLKGTGKIYQRHVVVAVMAMAPKEMILLDQAPSAPSEAEDVHEL